MLSFLWACLWAQISLYEDSSLYKSIFNASLYVNCALRSVLLPLFFTCIFHYRKGLNFDSSEGLVLKLIRKVDPLQWHHKPDSKSVGREI